MTTEQPLLEIKNVSQIYGNEKRSTAAITDVSFNVRDGEFVSIVGPSGCGKSTLLRMITGLQTPTSGEVYYRGKRLNGVNRHATIVFQTFALFPWLTALENVEVALKARNIAPKLRTVRAMDLLDRVGLDGYENAYPHELSGGTRQKVGLARAIAVEPELLCLDEPFSALDIMSAEAMRGELLELWSSGKLPIKAILLVTHNIEEAVFLGDRILVMDKQPGRVVANMKVDLPHPRYYKYPKFVEVVDSVYATLAGQTQPEHLEMGAAPGGTGPTRALPHVNVNELAGLVEHLFQLPKDQEDLYRLAGDLKIDSDDLLRLTEACELLGFATVAKGDIALTPLGETFAEASIQARKEIFSSRVRRLPVFKWLTALLDAAEPHKLDREEIMAALELEFPSKEADLQLETAIRWGRYAEILTYDDNEGMIYLEPKGMGVTIG